MTLLIGHSSVYPDTDQGIISTGVVSVYKFTAAASGVVDELQFRTGSPNVGTFTLKLGIYDATGAGGEPGTLLGSGTTGSVTDDTWMSATGIAATVVSGSDYWLAVLPVGGTEVYYPYDTGSSDNPQHFADFAGFPYSTLASTWPGTDTAYNNDTAGSIGFQGLGAGSAPAPAKSTESLELAFTLCNLDGEVVDQITGLAEGDGFTVTLNDARVGQCTISLDDELATDPAPSTDDGVRSPITEHRDVIRVTYGDTIGINGIVGAYKVNGQTGRMSIPLRDSFLRLERRALRYGHVSVDDGYSRDGRGVRTIFTDIEPAPGGAHPNGIVIDGPNTTTDSTDVNTAQRGGSPADEVKALAAGLGDLDFELVPVDETHPPTSRAWASGDLVELATWAFQGIDRTDPTSDDYLSFDFESGAGNLADFTAGPDAEAVVNYAVCVASGGEVNQDDTDFRRLATAASWAFDGILERWEAVDVGDQMGDESLADYQARVRALLLARAEFLIKEYAHAPLITELVLPVDRDGIPAWGRDYGVGDRVRVNLERGSWSYRGAVRIVSVQVAKSGNAGGVQQTLQVTPLGVGTSVPDEETGT